MTDPITGYLRAKAICLFLKEDRLLAIDGFDPTKQQRFWVPIGGRVELGESSRDAIVRELREELSTEVEDLRLLGVLENIFTFDGGPGHEIVFVYDATFVDNSFYERKEVVGLEGDSTFTARWIDPRAPSNGWPLYPDGLEDLLAQSRAAG